MHLRRHLTYSNVLATLALFLSISGTAFAAVTLTGRQIKDSTLTGADVKNGSLAYLDLDARAKAALKGRTGAAGAAGLAGAKGTTGPKGDVGPKGDPGAKGDPGSPAKVVASFSSEDNGAYLSPAQANVNGQDWYLYDGSDGDTDPDAIDPFSPAPTLDYGPFSDLQFLIGLADTAQAGGYLTVDYKSAVNAVASVSLLHRGSLHTRAECQLWVKDVDSATAQFAMGDAVYVSSNTPNEMVTVSLVGSRLMGFSTGNTYRYDVQVRCRDADRGQPVVPGNRWEYVRANLTAFAASEA